MDYDSYSADVAQDDYDKKATHKGPGLKIGKDHALAKHIEQKYLKINIPPMQSLWKFQPAKYQFDTTISTRTLYNYIENGVFLNLTNKDLPRQGKNPKAKI